MSDLDAVLDDAFRVRFMRRMGNAVQHDLRSPLQGLGFCLDLVQKSAQALPTGDPARASIEKAVATARRELERMERTALGLMADAGIVQDEISRFDLARLTREVAHHFVTETAMRGVQFVVSAPQEPVFVSGPRAEIGRAIMVCIVDAVDSVPDAGRIEVTVRADGERAAVEVLGTAALDAPAAKGTDAHSFAAMGIRYARSCVEAHGGEFISEDRDLSRHRATGLRFPLAR